MTESLKQWKQEYHQVIPFLQREHPEWVDNNAYPEEVFPFTLLGFAGLYEFFANRYDLDLLTLAMTINGSLN